MKTAIKEEDKPISSFDVKNTDKKHLNNYTTNSLHNTTEHATILKKCICYTNYCGDNLIKNKVCTICNRNVDNVNTCDNSIKKKYQQELNRHRYYLIKQVNLAFQVRTTRIMPTITALTIPIKSY